MITFEGIDGSGKSTITEHAFKFFKEKYPGLVIKARDPGATKISERIRDILMYEKGLCRWTELSLFEGARAQLVEEFLIPNLKQGKIIFLDRYYDSTIAYQGFRNNIPLEAILNRNKAILQGTEPDLTLLFNLPVEVALKRIKKDNRKLTTFDKEEKEQHLKVQQGYHWIANTSIYQIRVRIIDASKPLKEVKQNTIKAIDEFLSKYF